MVCWSPVAPAPVIDDLGLGEEEESFMSLSSFFYSLILCGGRGGQPRVGVRELGQREAAVGCGVGHPGRGDCRGLGERNRRREWWMFLMLHGM